MRTFTQLFVLIVLCLLMNYASAGQNANGCSSGKRADGIFYTDCWTDAGDDTSRLQDAIDTATGKLIFNENAYYVTDALVLHSYMVIEGLGSGPAHIYPAETVIHLNPEAEDKSIFFIGPGIYGVTIRDLGFYNDSAPSFNGNIGIHIEGYDINDATSTHFEFDNLRFAWFDKGFYVKATNVNSGWQFDNAKLSNSSFAACNWGVHLNSQNASMELNNVVFNNQVSTTDDPTDQNGIWLERAGYVIMNYVVGNGTVDDGLSAAGTFILINTHGNITMNSVNGEAFQRELIIDQPVDGYKFCPIVITNSIFPACQDNGTADLDDPLVLIKNATVISQGNTWSCQGVAKPVVREKSDVYSVGDRFCYDSPSANSNCFQNGGRSGFVVKSNNAVVRSDHSTDVDDLTLPAFEILTASYLSSKPLLALTSSVWDDGGTGNVYKATYAFTRNSTNGRLEIAGDESAPRTGYTFKNGPVQLQSATAGTLSNYNISSDSGSMLYCSDCTAPSTPCSGSGSGALALRVGSQWNCK